MIDHLVYATPSLAQGVAEIEALTGVRASVGGQHLAWGTHNSLVALGPDTYLEIIAPDPSQPTPKEPRPFGIDLLHHSRLASWAVRHPDFDRVLIEAAERGLPLGSVLSGNRVRPDGITLEWRLTSPWSLHESGLVPFLIDWGSSPHPAAALATGLSLVQLRAEHPRPDLLARRLALLDVALPVVQASHKALVATVDCPKGRVELR